MSERLGGAEGPNGRDAGCVPYRQLFSAYLDGALDGVSMTGLARHLDSCQGCREEFRAWRAVQETLGAMGPASFPAMLEAHLRDALASERDRQTHLSPWRQVRQVWRNRVAPAALRMSAGLAATLVLTGSVGWLLGSALPVQANDDRMIDLRPPVFLYSEVPPEPIANSGRFTAVLVDAKIDARGHVYDYDVVQGPDDAETRVRVGSNLLTSVFKPATVFGVPVPGHVMMTYAVVSLRG